MIYNMYQYGMIWDDTIIGYNWFEACSNPTGSSISTVAGVQTPEKKARVKPSVWDNLDEEVNRFNQSQQRWAQAPPPGVCFEGF